MNKYLRLILVLALASGIALLARGKVAWATPSGEASLSASAQEDQSPAAKKDVDCDKPENKHKKECKGTVKPPHPGPVIIPVTGSYSVGGFCTLDIIFTDPTVSLNADIQTPLPGELPDDVQRVRQGCLLTYFDEDGQIDAIPPGGGSTTICFAAIPGSKPTTLYFYDLYAPEPAWVPLPTTVENGVACATGNASGVYVATFQK